jgi:hypothetical protein
MAYPEGSGIDKEKQVELGALMFVSRPARYSISPSFDQISQNPTSGLSNVRPSVERVVHSRIRTALLEGTRLFDSAWRQQRRLTGRLWKVLKSPTYGERKAPTDIVWFGEVI